MADKRIGQRGGKRSSSGDGNESSIGVLVTACLSGIQSLYVATHSTVVTVLGAVLVAALVVVVMIMRKNSR